MKKFVPACAMALLMSAAIIGCGGSADKNGGGDAKLNNVKEDPLPNKNVPPAGMSNEPGKNPMPPIMNPPPK